ncbi:MAG: TolC family protein, partial [Candidatus Latescibacterota bacterium]
NKREATRILNMNLLHITAVSLLFFTLPVCAQQPLSLQECIDLAMGRNLQHQRNEQTLAASRASLESAQAPFGFNMDANFTAPTFTEVRDTQESVALATRVRDESTNFTYNGNLRMSRRLPYVGAIQLTTSGERRDFSSNRRNNFLDFSGDMRLDYEHDILNRAPEEVSLQRAKHNFANADLNFKQQSLQLEGQVIDDYYTLVQRLRQLEIQKQRLDLSRANLELAQRKFEVGLIAEVEALRLQVELLQAESSFAQAETAIESQRDLLRQTLGLSPEDPLEISIEVENKLYAIDAQEAMRLGLQRRTDMRQTEISEKLRRLDLEDAHRRNGINATLNANISLRGRGDEIGDISSTLERNQWGVGIQVTMPLIDNGARRSSLNQARIALQQSQLTREMQRQQVVRHLQEGEHLRGARRRAQFKRGRTTDYHSSGRT